MPPIAFDATYRADLAARTDYDLWALQHFRSCFHRQSEAPGPETTFTLGDVTSSGELRAFCRAEFVADFCEGAVRESLAHFRPLAFVAAFKLQDMISEWILASWKSPVPVPFQFKEKLKQYASLKAAHSPPPEFVTCPDIADGHWALYRALEAPRGAVIHSGGAQQHADGRLEIVDRKGATLVLTEDEQGAYIRFVCVLTRVLLGITIFGPSVQELLRNDLAALTKIHGISGFVATTTRYARARVVIPEHMAKSLSPYSFEIDIATICQRMTEHYPPGSGQLAFDLEMVGAAPGLEYVWRIPPELVHSVPSVVQVNDLALSAFLTTRPTS